MLTVTTHLKSQRSAVEDQARDLVRQVKKTEADLKKWRSRTAVVDAVSRWQAAEIHWLDELRDLSERLPTADQAVVQRITMAPTSRGTGVVSMSVRVSTPEIIDQLESKLRDEFHQVSSKRVSQSEGQQAFPCQFETSVVVQPHPPEAATPTPTASEPLAATQN